MSPFTAPAPTTGFDLHGRNVGVVGTGKIGECICRIMAGFGCHLLAFDPRPIRSASV